MAYNFIDGHGGYIFDELAEEINKFNQHDNGVNFYNRTYIKARESIDWIALGHDIEKKIQFLVDWKTDYVRIHRKEYQDYFRKLADHSQFVSMLQYYVNIDLPTIDLSNQNIQTDISFLYGVADSILKPTAASKIMHMYNPNLFPIWDQRMREYLYRSDGHNPGHYVRWMALMQKELNLVMNQFMSSLNITEQEAVDRIKQLDNPTCCLLRIMDKVNYNNSRAPLVMPLSQEVTSEVTSYQTIRRTTGMLTRSNSNNLAILAPVPRSFLNTAIRHIYPTHKKVSFGANKVEELQTIRNDFLNAIDNQGNVCVYIYVDGSAQYKSVLIDEFLFYTQTTSHPDPWGSWNDNFKSYYTVKDIVSCNIPLPKFKSFITGKVIENVRRPLRVIDPE